MRSIFLHEKFLIRFFAFCFRRKIYCRQMNCSIVYHLEPSTLLLQGQLSYETWVWAHPMDKVFLSKNVKVSAWKDIIRDIFTGQCDQVVENLPNIPKSWLKSSHFFKGSFHMRRGFDSIRRKLYLNDSLRLQLSVHKLLHLLLVCKKHFIKEKMRRIIFNQKYEKWMWITRIWFSFQNCVLVLVNGNARFSRNLLTKQDKVTLDHKSGKTPIDKF